MALSFRVSKDFNRPNNFAFLTLSVKYLHQDAGIFATMNQFDFSFVK
jgi:hypothetical protein